MFTRKFLSQILILCVIITALATFFITCQLLPMLQKVEAVGCVTYVSTPTAGTDSYFAPHAWEPHRVQEGETIWELVAASLGEARDRIDIRWVVRETIRYNKKDSSNLIIGEIIYLPR